MPKVIDDLRREHTDMMRLCDVVAREIETFQSGGVVDFELLQLIVDYSLDYPGRYHHPKEDLALEKLRARAPQAAQAVGDLAGEHVKQGQLTRKLADTLSDASMDQEIPRDDLWRAAAEFIAFSRTHIEFEERELFPALLSHLGDADWADIETRAEAATDPLFGERSQEQYRHLREALLNG